MTQHTQILELLSDNQWHCAKEIRDKIFAYDYRKRISELNQKGFEIKSEPCHDHNHSSNLHRYKFIPKEPLTLFPKVSTAYDRKIER